MLKDEVNWEHFEAVPKVARSKKNKNARRFWNCILKSSIHLEGKNFLYSTVFSCVFLRADEATTYHVLFSPFRYLPSTTRSAVSRWNPQELIASLQSAYTDRSIYEAVGSSA